MREPGTLPEPDVLVIGAGPVGLLLANLLGKAGLSVRIAERRVDAAIRSMAIGIMPPSLAILARVGLDEVCVSQGVAVKRTLVHDGQRLLGQVTFDALPGRYPYVLSLPQARTLHILEGGVAQFANVRLERGLTLRGLTQDAGGVTAEFDVAGGGERRVRAGYVIACDGHTSTARSLTGIAIDERPHGQTFLMADFDDNPSLGRHAHIFLTPDGSVEAFPLPDGRRRWIVMTDRLMVLAPPGYLAGVVEARTGIALGNSPMHFESAFAVREFLARSYYRGRVVLCGDAAHVMSPIGGQGMNTGFADAAMLADVLREVIRGAAAAAPLLAQYESIRRRAFTVAARRAVRGMRLGTLTGKTPSRIRSLFLRRLLLRSPVVDRLPPYFAMLTIPGNNWVTMPAT